MSKKCSHAEDCPLFERFKLTSVLRVWQIYFCEGRYEDCVRYQMNCRGELPSPTLLPNGEELAEGEA